MNLRVIRIAIFTVMFLVVGIIFLVTGIKQKIEYNQPRVRLETVTADELREGMFVEGEISKMRTMAKEADNYYKNDIELKTTMHFVGKVQALKGEYLDYFKEYNRRGFDGARTCRNDYFCREIY